MVWNQILVVLLNDKSSVGDWTQVQTETLCGEIETVENDLEPD